MKKTEVLCPAGNIDMLKLAVNGGSDAVYIGGKSFSARAFAPNFSLDEIDEATKFCHIHGVKIYVAVNTLIKEDELNEAKAYLRKLYNIGVDAVILTDIGLSFWVKNALPDLVMHASTQLSVTTIEEINALKDLGFKRVVLARELSFSEIKALSLKTDLEIEIFVHGALCVSMSGKCFLSSYFGNRSANRGMCAQPCRLSTGNKFYLSLKDLCLVKKIKEIKALKFVSLKVEGRMKQDEYSYFAAKCYQKAINELDYNSDLKNLSIIFNRGYTEGYFTSKPEKTLHYGNHLGICVGEVVKSENLKTEIKLNVPVFKGDALRIVSTKTDAVIISQEKNDFITVRTHFPVKTGSKCFLTKRIFSKINLKKEGVIFRFFQDENDSFLELNNSEIKVTEKIPHLKEEVKNKTQIEYVKSHLSRIDNPYFYIDKVFVKLKYFIQNKTLTELKNKVIASFILKLLKAEKVQEKTFSYPKLDPYFSSELVDKGSTKYLFEERAFFYKDAHFKEMLSVSKNTQFLSPYFGVFNHLSLVYFLSKGVKTIFYSFELTFDEIKKIQEAFKKIYNFYPNTGFYLKGTPRLMVFRKEIEDTIFLNKEEFKILKEKNLYFLVPKKEINNEKDIDKFMKIGVNNFYKE